MSTSNGLVECLAPPGYIDSGVVGPRSSRDHGIFCEEDCDHFLEGFHREFAAAWAVPIVEQKYIEEGCEWAIEWPIVEYIANADDAFDLSSYGQPWALPTSHLSDGAVRSAAGCLIREEQAACLCDAFPVVLALLHDGPPYEVTTCAPRTFDQKHNVARNKQSSRWLIAAQGNALPFAIRQSNTHRGGRRLTHVLAELRKNRP